MRSLNHPAAKTGDALSSRFRALAGFLAALTMILITSIWAFWRVAEFYYEARGLPSLEPLYYLPPFLSPWL